MEVNEYWQIIGSSLPPSSCHFQESGENLRLNITLTNQAFDVLEDVSVGYTFIFLVDDLINKRGKNTPLCFFELHESRKACSELIASKLPKP